MLNDHGFGQDSRRAPADSAVTELGGTRVLEIAAQSSHDFLDAAFAAYARRQVFAISRPDTSLRGMVGSVERLELPERPRLGWGHPSHEPSDATDAAQIVFTSGTEGPPKAIVLSHRNLADVVERLNAIMELTGEVREYVGVPVTYSFGLGRARAVAAVGGQIYLPERFDPAEIGRMLARGEINAASAVPSLWRLVLANRDAIGAAGSQMRWIEIGSQYMSGPDKSAMRELFPNARIVQHYGLTEASRSTFLDVSRAPEMLLDSVGRAAGSVALKIAQDGAVHIRGDHIALGRLGPGGTVVPLTEGEGWLATRDRGEIREDHLWYLGRLDDQINLAGIKVGAEMIERAVAEIVPAAAGRIAAAALSDPARGEVVLLAYEEDTAQLAPVIEAAARTVLARRGIEAPGALRVMAVDALPRTGTDKIRRAALPALWEEIQGDAVATDVTPGADLTDDEARVAAVWQRVLGPVPLSPESSYYDAGGDSLSSVQIGLVMEAERWSRKSVRATLEGRTIGEIAGLEGVVPFSEEPLGADPATAAPAHASDTLPDRTVRNWSVSIARGVMALSVLVSHWGPGLFGALGVGDFVERWFSTIYRAGTPGFAAVFGIGVGFYMLPDFAARREGIFRRMATSFRLVATGLVLLAFIDLLNGYMAGEQIGTRRFANAFYGVLAYYAFILGTARYWLPALAALRDPRIVLVPLVPAFWIAWQGSAVILPGDQFDILEIARLMAGQGGYNVFKMTMVAAAGAAIGYWIARQDDTRALSGTLLLGGGSAAALCFLAMGQVGGFDNLGDRDSMAFTSVPGLMFYVAAAATLIGGGMRILPYWERLSHAVRLPLKFLVVAGSLALPIYVLHQLVIPGRNLLLHAGLPNLPALALAMSLFLTAMGYAGRRLWRMYFG
ncbi:AMP-binding protein [Jannaschia sp. W003]|uniref:AMP-binding protein n=1 Tax=Jannaschia sp. W003 TaxID=2867012 RepID=UPI0021A557B9|nr:AMP-binding protein [Jannaschia sp. W003]UWQ20580.1 AMP-binding protein [Jannaschia sp. W003]